MGSPVERHTSTVSYLPIKPVYNQLPVELLEIIFGYIERFQDLVRQKAVCRKFRAVLQDLSFSDKLWKRFVAVHFPEYIPRPRQFLDDPFYTLFQTQHAFITGRLRTQITGYDSKVICVGDEGETYHKQVGEDGTYTVLCRPRHGESILFKKQLSFQNEVLKILREDDRYFLVAKHGVFCFDLYGAYRAGVNVLLHLEAVCDAVFYKNKILFACFEFEVNIHVFDYRNNISYIVPFDEFSESNIFGGVRLFVHRDQLLVTAHSEIQFYSIPQSEEVQEWEWTRRRILHVRCHYHNVGNYDFPDLEASALEVHVKDDVLILYQKLTDTFNCIPIDSTSGKDFDNPIEMDRLFTKDESDARAFSLNRRRGIDRPHYNMEQRTFLKGNYLLVVLNEYPAGGYRSRLIVVDIKTKERVKEFRLPSFGVRPGIPLPSRHYMNHKEIHSIFGTHHIRVGLQTD